MNCPIRNRDLRTTGTGCEIDLSPGQVGYLSVCRNSYSGEAHDLDVDVIVLSERSGKFMRVPPDASSGEEHVEQDFHVCLYASVVVRINRSDASIRRSPG